MNCTKIILSSYKNLSRAIRAIEDDIDESCVFSYNSKMPCALLADKICDKMMRKERLKTLKWKIDKVFSCLNDEEIDLLNCKYFGKPPRNKFEFSLRTYFRKQVKLLNKLDEYFSFIGINDDSFFQEFKNDSFIVGAAIKAEDIKRIRCLYFSDEKNVSGVIKKSA